MNKKSTHKILLVDDDGKNLQVAMNILKDFNVIYAQSGEKALELIKRNRFDLILLDIVMPVLDGYAVCKILKENNDTKNIPIIFLTVKDEEKDIVKGFELGAVDYITKPFFGEVLLKRVESHLNLSLIRRELEELNNNLTLKVNKQVEEIRKKDKIILRKSKIEAMSDMMDVISSQWKEPLNNLKIYLQTMSFNFVDNLEGNDIFEKILEQITILDEIMGDFHRFFNNKNSKKITNLKVLIDNVIYSFKDTLDKKNIEVKYEGDNLLFLEIIDIEIKHIFKKLLLNSIQSGENSSIDIKIIEKSNTLELSYCDNNVNFDKSKLNSITDIQKSIQENNFDLGFFLIKLFTEKNGAILNIIEVENKVKFKFIFSK